MSFFHLKSTVPFGCITPSAINICILTSRRCGWAGHAWHRVHKSNPMYRLSRGIHFTWTPVWRSQRARLIKKYDVIITQNERFITCSQGKTTLKSWCHVKISANEEATLNLYKYDTKTVPNHFSLLLTIPCHRLHTCLSMSDVPFTGYYIWLGFRGPKR